MRRNLKHEIYDYENLGDLRSKINDLQLQSFLPSLDSADIMFEKVQINKINRINGNRVEAANRFAAQPMEGCDGTYEGAPDELTKRRYMRFAEGGAGLIWVEATAVAHEGRANPRQLFLNEKTGDSFAQLADNIREVSMRKHGFAPVLILQATHSGRYSRPNGRPEPIIAYQNPIFEKDNPISPEHIITDDHLKQLETEFGTAAKLAQKSGFDGIDIKSCHRYLLCELLSAYNRQGIYGGSFENRTRMLRNSIACAKAETSSSNGFIITTRLNVYDGFPYPYGFGMNNDNDSEGLRPDFTEPLKLAEILHDEYDMRLINITAGNPYVNPHVNRPYDQGFYIPDEHPIEGVARIFACAAQIQRAFEDMTVIGSGFSYLRENAPYFAAGGVSAGMFKMAGFGREMFAYPQFVSDLKNNGAMDRKKVCISCGKCSELMRMGTTAGCVVRDGEVYLELYRENKK